MRLDSYAILLILFYSAEWWSCVNDKLNAPDTKIFTCDLPQRISYIDIDFEGDGVDALNVFDIQVHGTSFGKDGFLRSDLTICLHLRS